MANHVHAFNEVLLLQGVPWPKCSCGYVQNHTWVSGYERGRADTLAEQASQSAALEAQSALEVNNGL